jgi:carnitine-CoA ligase
MTSKPSIAFSLENPESWVLPRRLFELAQQRPSDVWVETAEGGSLTYSQAAENASKMAGHLLRLGVNPGDMVAVLLPNGFDFLQVWMGLGRFGATAVFLNTALRGDFLAHQLENSGVSLVITAEEFASAILELEPSRRQRLKRIAIVDSHTRPLVHGLDLVPWDWQTAPAYDGAWPSGSDIACVMYTSGTSGPSKGVLMPHAHCTLYGIGSVEALQISAADRYYVFLPLFHANGLLMQVGATLVAGCSLFMRKKFSASAWLDDLRASGATLSNHLGITAAFTLAQGETAGDKDHQLRAICCAPNTPEVEAQFRDRFGVRDVISGFGMTEVNICAWGRCGASRPGAAGWIYERHFDVIIADPDTDRPRARGEVGEILVRPKTPFAFMAGYFGMPEKTLEAWRNLWFHTGDAGVISDEGVLTYVDRLKDCIRRRSENISANEVETALAGLTGVAELAAFAVPSDIPGGEDEVMLAVVPCPGATLDVDALGCEADALLPRFASPRFIEFVSELPKTATGKVQRELLRRRGSAAAHDRVRA